MDEIRNFIVNYLERYGSLPQGDGLDGFNFVKTGLIDSMAIFKFMVAMEDSFGVEFTDEDIAGPEFQTIGGLAGMIYRKRGAHGA